jgi:N-acetylneuraminic acid mutarotase
VTFTANGTYSDAVTAPIPAGEGEWANAPPLPFQSENLAAAGLGGKVYAMGGQLISFLPSSVTNQLAAFDPATQSWTALKPMLVKRVLLSATTAGGLVYAIGGRDDNGTPLASMERYDPATDTWTMRASMSAPRRGLVAGSVNGIIHAAGGADASGTPVATLETYNPATDTWTLRAPMPTPRSSAAGGVIDGILYVVGGSDGTSPVSTVEAYDPASNTWTTRAPMPAFLGTSAAAVADGVLYVITQTAAVYAYDPVADSWSAKAPLGGFRVNLAATSLNGIVYAIGGNRSSPFCCNKTVNTVEVYVDSLRWSSSPRGVVRIDQNGRATAVAAGTATIVANVGTQTCGASCPTVVVPPPTAMSLDAPVSNASFTAGTTLTIGGWALNTGAPAGTGVDTIHVYAHTSAGNAIFLGVAPYGAARPDVGAVYGAQFTNSGFTLIAGSALSVGDYTIVAYAHNALTQQFDVAKSAAIHVMPTVSNPFIAVDAPLPGATVTSAFEVGGWALDAGAPTGTGVDAVHVYVFPNAGASPGVFIGTGSYGLSRPDVAAIFGSRFTNTGYHLTITGLGPGTYVLGIYARSTVTGSFSIVKVQRFLVSATALMSIDTPGAESTISSPTFGVGGWSIDRAVEPTAQSGTGVDTLHVYAYPNPGSGLPPIFLGVATVGIARPDVATAYGSRYGNAGYVLGVDRATLGLTPGVYIIAVHSHSTVTNTFNNVAVVRVTLQ